MTFNKNEEKNFNSICNTKKHVNNPVIKDKDVGGVHSSWSLSADEDYIVFCFGKDVAQENKGVKDLNHTSSRPVNRKVCNACIKFCYPVWLSSITFDNL